MEEYKARQQRKPKQQEADEQVVMDQRLHENSNLERVYSEIRESLKSKSNQAPRHVPKSCKVQNDDIMQQYQMEAESYLKELEEKKKEREKEENEKKE